MNLRWKKFLLLPRSSIRYLHSPPSLRPAEFVLCIAKRRNEGEKEREREGGGWGNGLETFRRRRHYTG